MDSGLTLVDLAKFTGKDPNYYGRFVIEAIEQGEDLFELASLREVMPDKPIEFRLARRGILAMAEALYEGQPNRDIQFSPFRSETIGSYTYSTADSAIQHGIPTGVAWFDLSVERLRTQIPLVDNVSIHAFDRPFDLVTVNGEKYLPGPADWRSRYIANPSLDDAFLDRNFVDGTSSDAWGAPNP